MGEWRWKIATGGAGCGRRRRKRAKVSWKVGWVRHGESHSLLIFEEENIHELVTRKRGILRAKGTEKSESYVQGKGREKLLLRRLTLRSNKLLPRLHSGELFLQGWNIRCEAGLVEELPKNKGARVSADERRREQREERRETRREREQSNEKNSPSASYRDLRQPT